MPMRRSFNNNGNATAMRLPGPVQQRKAVDTPPMRPSFMCEDELRDSVMRESADSDFVAHATRSPFAGSAATHFQAQYHHEALAHHQREGASLEESLVSTPDARSTRASMAHVTPLPHGLCTREPPRYFVPVKYRHNPRYDLSDCTATTKTSDFYTLERSSMPAPKFLDGCGRTPQPKENLVHCTFYPIAAVLAAANDMKAQDADFAAAMQCGAAPAITNVMGQVLFTAPEGTHRGVLAIVLPGVPMTPPTVHQAAGHDARNRKLNKGFLHFDVPAVDAERVLAAHQNAYYDVDGVWIAHTPAAVRELALFEMTMRHYKNGVKTGRPMAPIVVERSRRVGTTGAGDRDRRPAPHHRAQAASPQHARVSGAYRAFADPQPAARSNAW